MLVLKSLPVFYFFCIVVTQETDSEIAEQLFRKLFKRQRIEHWDAIKSFSRITSYEKQYSMILMMAEKVFSIIQESRAAIEASPYIPGVSEFPIENTVRESLASILENTALFAELVLRFPDVAVAVLKSNNNWDVLLQWGIAFSEQVRYLLDNSTVQVLHMASQELHHIPRPPDYINPYRMYPEEEEEKIDEVPKVKKKKKKPIKKGPRLSTSHVEL